MKRISNLYIPIDFSNLPSVIPQGGNILYSTLCYAEKTQPEKKEWNCHFLISDLGIGFTGPIEDAEKELKFFTWIDLHQGYNQFRNKKIYIDSTWFTAINFQESEPSKEFKNRAKRFGSFCEHMFSVYKYQFINYFLKNTSDYYVPLDHSTLNTLFPERDKILYSTLCKVRCRYFNPHAIGPTKRSTKKWDTHLLMSRTGIAFKGNRRNICLPWTGVPKVKLRDNKTIRIRGLKFKGINNNNKTSFEVYMDNRYESQDSFLDRSRNFGKYSVLAQEGYHYFFTEMMNYTENLREKYAYDGIDVFLDKVIPFLSLGYTSKVLEILEEVIKIIPETEGEEIWYYKGQALRILNRDQEALDSYIQALNINPQNEMVRDKSYELQHKINLDSVPKKDKKNADKLFRKAHWKFTRKKKFELSLPIFEDSVKKNPFNIEALKYLGLNYEALGRKDEAIKYFQNILDMFPKNEEANENLNRINSTGD